jgi:hypothetical protein
MNHWVIVRTVIIGFAGISSALAPADPSMQVLVGLEAVLVGFLFFPVIVCIGLCVFLPFRSAKLKLSEHYWSHSPFDFSRPEQFFHMAGYGVLATGAGLLTSELWGSSVGLVSAFAVAALGGGILVGLWILGLFARRQAKF